MWAGDAGHSSREPCIEKEYAEDGRDLGIVQLALIFGKGLQDHGSRNVAYQAQKQAAKGPIAYFYNTMLNIRVALAPLRVVIVRIAKASFRSGRRLSLLDLMIISPIIPVGRIL